MSDEQDKISAGERTVQRVVLDEATGRYFACASDGRALCNATGKPILFTEPAAAFLALEILEMEDAEPAAPVESLRPDEAGTGLYLVDQDDQLWVRTPHSGWLRCCWTPDSVDGRVFRRKLVAQRVASSDRIRPAAKA